MGVRTVRLYGKEQAPNVFPGKVVEIDSSNHTIEGLKIQEWEIMEVIEPTRAMSKSEGKPKLGNIFRWLDEEFLLLMAEGMRVPVEVLKKYPKNNWKSGKGDEGFAEARKESALRHLRAALNGEDIDVEVGVSHLAMVAINCMMVAYAERANGERS